jgi:hypothetical protein
LLAKSLGQMTTLSMFVYQQKFSINYTWHCHTLGVSRSHPHVCATNRIGKSRLRNELKSTTTMKFCRCNLYGGTWNIRGFPHFQFQGCKNPAATLIVII